MIAPAIKNHLENVLFYAPYNVKKLAYKGISHSTSDQMAKMRYTFETSIRHHGAVFIHIPKTAGTSINLQLFGDSTATHFGIWHAIQTLSEEEFNTSFKFAFVRHPLDRLVSAFEFMKAGGFQTDFDRSFLAQYGDEFGGEFEPFVRWLSHEQNAYEHTAFIPQHEFVCIGDRIAVDYIGRFENLESDYACVARRLNIDLALPKTNSTVRRPYSSYYNDDLSRLAYLIYRKDFEIFGYNP